MSMRPYAILILLRVVAPPGHGALPGARLCARRRFTILLRSSVIFLLGATSFAQIPVPDHPLATLKQVHPRLLVSEADFARLRELINADATAAGIYADLKSQADQILDQPTVTHQVAGRDMLAESRLCLERVYTLALVYRMSGQEKYRDRARTELRTAASFADWNPSHFLDVAEMTHALAIGYDWLYRDLTPQDRALLRAAITEKGLDEATKSYKNRDRWTLAPHNWNLVCNGGISLGALAIADEDSQRAESILKQSIASIQLAMASYAPDGGWAEGPSYWQFGTTYAALYLAGLKSALDTDFGLSNALGFAHTGDFRLYFQGTSGTFSFADAQQRPSAPVMFWLAKRFSQPVFAWDELRHLANHDRFRALDLVWYQAVGQDPVSAKWPTRKIFEGVNVGFLRNDWLAPDATWIGVKGGRNNVNHSHLDLGSFVLDAHGTRWALDLGGDNYNLPGYFGAERFNYYRTSTVAHNTVLLDNENQDPMANAPMTLEDGVITIDLAAAYPRKVRKFLRSVERTPQNAIVIRDDIEALNPVEALWGMLTDAEISLNGRYATLRKGNATLAIEIVSPKDAEFDSVSTMPSRNIENPNTGTRKLLVRLKKKVTSVHIEVEFR